MNVVKRVRNILIQSAAHGGAENEHCRVKPRYIVIGVDQSLTGTGLAILNNHGTVLGVFGWTDKKKLQQDNKDILCYYKLKSNPSESDKLYRVCLMANWVLEIISKVAARGVDVYAAIEGYAYSKGLSNAASQLHELAGVIKSAVFRCNIPLRVYNPEYVKLAATGYGGATKEAMIAASRDAFNQDFSRTGSAEENLVDALFIARLLRDELELKAGRLLLDKVDHNLRRVMLAVGKRSPEALISRPFIRIGNAQNTTPVYARGPVEVD